MTRDELIAAATELHDREGCSCDRKYLMSCPRLANAILRSGAAARARRDDDMATRPEDRNSSHRFEAFEDAATLADLEAYIAHVRGLGAPDDAHPRVKLNEDDEIIGIVCTVKRHPEINEIAERNRR